MNSDINHTMRTIGQQARRAARVVARASTARKNAALLAIRAAIESHRNDLIAANERDLLAARNAQLSAPLLDRLTLTHQSLDHICAGLEQVAALPDPVGELDHYRARPNGLRIGQMRVPIGVVGIIYESRPNVTIDAAALTLKSGNASILRGGSEALHSNTALAGCIALGLNAAGLPTDAVQVVQTSDRAAVGQMITMTEFIDVIIPRGGKGLIERLSADARVPLIKHLDGNCHVYVDSYADLEQAAEIAFNAKTYRYGICGAMETLLVHTDVAERFLPPLASRLGAHGVEIRGCALAQSLIPHAQAASEDDWFTEYLGPTLAIRIVDSIDQAIEHIEHYGSHHTDSICTTHMAHAERFVREVDSASVMVNAPTCFADGFEYGLGAEIGISTNKLHARGPVGLVGLTTQKYVVHGAGQLRGKTSSMQQAS